MTLEDIKNAMYHTKEYQSEIPMVFHTNLAGMEMFSLALEKENNRDFVTFLFNKGEIKKQEHSRLHDMINSADKENYIIARCILENKSKNLENGTNLSSNKS